MPQKSNNPWDPNQPASSPVPQDRDDELEMADDSEDFDDEDFDDENETDEDVEIED